ncbi:MAG: glucose 1-dehydrogenase [Gammaproteobacteria bacterium]|nr:glucose 1-dehydrogenase [Gammaproteobacteria bacterium]
MNATDLTGKAAIVFGGTAGIGLATVRLLIERGARVLAAGLNSSDARVALAGVGDEASLLWREVDVRDEAAVSGAVAAAAEAFGRVDIAINNAGVESSFGPVQDAQQDEFDKLMGINLRGIWLGLKYEIPHMLAHGGGAIVNTSSQAGVAGIANVALYTASKHAVVGLTRAVALENAIHNIRVNAVAPGPVDTGLLHRMVDGHIPVSVIADSVPMKRVSQPAEIAEAIVWLASDAASYVTGHVLVADGGITAA